ncbi:hypothetical protein EON65_39705 [archaeon]|nr:MAG: hypothetical protein EON65_39705 [archaeon]
MRKESLILLINIGIALAVTLIIVLFHLAPLFTCYILAICILAFFFILTEKMITHHAAEFENRFWTLMAFLLARTCLFCQDSPLKFPKERDGVAWCIVCFFTYLAHNYDRHLRRMVLTKAPNIKRVRSAEFADTHRANARSKLIEIREHINSIDLRWMSSTFLNMFFLPRVLCAEHGIIMVIAEANTEELNLIINNVELPLILYKIKDHRVARQFNRTKLLNLLAKERINELSVPSKALLLDALQKLKLTAHAQSEAFVKNIIFSTKTDELSELKCITDSKGDINSMHKLVYMDIRNSVTKADILNYIAAQAEIQAAHAKIGSRAAKRRGKFAWRKILSDVDDTLSCSGGSWPAGMDTSYPKKAVYPGVMAFYRELDLGVSGAEEWDDARIGNLVFLSARPHVYKDVSENVTYVKFKQLQEERGLYTSPSLLAGSLDTGSQFMIRGDSEPLARKKFDNFKEFLTLYPEFTFIFIGDNGQGDVRTAELVLGDSKYKHNLQRVYVHEVQDLQKTYIKDARYRSRQTEHICYFDTYIDAAIDAYQHKLIRLAGLRRVMEEAKQDFAFIRDDLWMKKSPPLPPSQTAPVVGSGAVKQPKEITVVDVTQTASNPPSVPSTPSRQPPTKALGATERGKEKHKLVALWKVRLHSERRAQKKASSSSTTSAEPKLTYEGLIKKFHRVQELNKSIERGNVVLLSHGLESISPLPYPQVVGCGEIVLTDFGLGMVKNFRVDDGIYSIEIQGGSLTLLYVHASTIFSS